MARKPKYFDQRVIRLLSRECVANELGSAVCWLISVIVMQERVVEFKRPVTYYNEQLMPLVGVATNATLKRVRDKAIKAGWLEYEKGGPEVPGLYSIKIPKRFEKAWDGPISEAGSWDDAGRTPPPVVVDGATQASDRASDRSELTTAIGLAIFHRNKKESDAERHSLSYSEPRGDYARLARGVGYGHPEGMTGLSQGYLDALQAKFPGVSVVFQIERMNRWLSEKWQGGERFETFNFHGFIVEWLHNQSMGDSPEQRKASRLGRKIARRAKVV